MRISGLYIDKKDEIKKSFEEVGEYEDIYPIVDANIGKNQTGVRLLVDTGCTMSAIRDDIAIAAGFIKHPYNCVTVNPGHGGPSERASIYRGELLLDNLKPMDLVWRQYRGDHDNYVGIIGLRMFIQLGVKLEVSESGFGITFEDGLFNPD